MSFSKTYTLTFGDRCENHGMEIKGIDVGKGKGFNKEDLEKVYLHFEKKDVNVK